MFPYYVALVAAIITGVAGQIALKHGADGNATTTMGQFLNPATILGLGIYAAAALLYIVALKKIPISQAYPTVASSYVLVALVAHFLWNEPFGIPQMAGIALICGGIVMLHQ